MQHQTAQKTKDYWILRESTVSHYGADQSIKKKKKKRCSTVTDYNSVQILPKKTKHRTQMIFQLRKVRWCEINWNWFWTWRLHKTFNIKCLRKSKAVRYDAIGDLEQRPLWVSVTLVTGTLIPCEETFKTLIIYKPL